MAASSFAMGTANGDENTNVAFDVSKEEAETLMQDLGTLAGDALSALPAPLSAVMTVEAPAAE